MESGKLSRIKDKIHSDWRDVQRVLKIVKRYVKRKKAYWVYQVGRWWNFPDK